MEIKFDFNWIKKNFYFVVVTGDNDRLFGTLQLVPNNTELLEYYDNILYYGTSELYLKECLRFRDILDSTYKIANNVPISPNEYIIFKFKNEEDAFYFNLKFS